MCLLRQAAKQTLLDDDGVGVCLFLSQTHSQLSACDSDVRSCELARAFRGIDDRLHTHTHTRGLRRMYYNFAFVWRRVVNVLYNSTKTSKISEKKRICCFFFFFLFSVINVVYSLLVSFILASFVLPVCRRSMQSMRVQGLFLYYFITTFCTYWFRYYSDFFYVPKKR